MFLNDKFLAVWDSPRVEDCLEDMRGCVKEKNVEGFDEAIVKYGQLIQELTLKIDKEIAIPTIV